MTDHSPNPSPEQLGKREIRVFISSTFRDMMRERDLLVKEVLSFQQPLYGMVQDPLEDTGMKAPSIMRCSIRLWSM